MTRFVVCVLVILLAGSLVGPASGMESQEDTTITEIDADHDLLSDSELSRFDSEGIASTSLEQIDAEITIGKTTDDVGLSREDSIANPHVLNDFLRIQYNEDISRTLRIWIPAEYASPYERSGVVSLTSDHTADLTPIRDRAFLEVIIHVDGPTDAVIPLSKSASLVEGGIDARIDSINQATGEWLGGDTDWNYIENISENGSIHEIEVNNDDVLIQYDTTEATASARWINVPRGDARGVPVYYHIEDNGSVYVVTKSDDRVDIRYAVETSPRDRISGWVNDARSALEEIPDRVRDVLPDRPFANTGGV